MPGLFWLLQGSRPRGLSAGTEAGVVFEDIGKLNHQFAHAVDGEVITAVTTCVPPNWGGAPPTPTTT